MGFPGCTMTYGCAMKLSCATMVVTLLYMVPQTYAAEVSVQDSVRKYRYLASIARERQDFAEAERYYAEYLRYRPDDALGHYRLGQVRLQIQDIGGAKEALLKAVAMDSLHVNTNVRLYGIYINAGKTDSAAMCLDRVLRVRSEDESTRRVLADLYRRDGRTQEALGHYEILAARTDVREELYELLALLNEDLGRTSEALSWRAKLVTIREENGNQNEQREALEAMLRLQQQRGDTDSAYQTLEQMALIDSANRYSYYSRMASLAEENDDHRVRLRAWEAMAEADPQDLDTIIDLIEHYLNSRDLQRATQWLEEGLKADSRNAHLRLLQGDVLVLQGLVEPALAAFEQAKADPRWEVVAQQRIWQLRPPETEEERLLRDFFRNALEPEN